MEIRVLKIKYGNWSFENYLKKKTRVLKIIWKLEFWKLKLEIEVLKIEVLKIKFEILKFWRLNLKLKFWKLFENWSFKNWSFEIYLRIGVLKIIWKLGF